MLAEDPMETIRRISRNSLAWIGERSVGLYRQMPDGGNPVLEGSGVLLQVADAAFVVSAGHVLRAGSEAAIHVGAMVDQTRTVVLRSDFRISSDLVDDDVGFAPLSAEQASKLSSYGKRFVRMTEVDRYEEPVDGLYSIVGFPKQVNSPNYETKIIDVLPFLYGTSLDTANEGKRGVSLVVRCTTNTVIVGAEEIRMPHLGGISGCGMWRLYAYGERIDRTDAWDPTCIRLAGIEHSWLERKYIKGTLAGRVISLLENAYPELRPCLRLSAPL